MPNRFVAILPLTQSVAFTHEQVLARLSGLFPSMATKFGVVRPGGFAAGGEGKPCRVSVGSNVIAVCLFPGTARDESFESLDVLCPAWFGLRCSRPKTHAYVIVASEQEATHPAQALAAAAAVSMVAAALVSVAPVAEIIWKTGAVSSEPQAFQRTALRLTIPEINIGHWLSRQRYEGPSSPQRKPSLIIHSKGLTPFFGRELETVPSGLAVAELERRLLAVAEFLILYGPSLHDNMQLFVPDQDCVKVRMRDRGLVDPNPVLLLRLEACAEPSWQATAPVEDNMQGRNGFGRRAIY